jgi:hypothetical protein
MEMTTIDLNGIFIPRIPNDTPTPNPSILNATERTISCNHIEEYSLPILLLRTVYGRSPSDVIKKKSGTGLFSL